MFLLQTRSGRQLTKNCEPQSSEKSPAAKRLRNSPRLNDTGRERSQNGWHNIEVRDARVLTANDRILSADLTDRDTANLQRYPLSNDSITDLGEIMEVEERPTVNTTGNAPFESEKDITEPKRTRRARTRHTSMLERLAPTPGFVDKTPIDCEGGSLAQRRTPRMASLNAAAKVNVFFEPSSPLAGRSLMEIQHHSHVVKKPPSRSSTERSNSDKANSNSAENSYEKEEFADSEVFLQGEVTSTWDAPRSKGVIVSPKDFESLKENTASSHFEFVTNGHRTGRDHKRKPEADSTSEGERNAKKIHLDGGSEPVIMNAEEMRLFEGGDESREIECDTTTDSPPKTMVDQCIQVDLPRPEAKHMRVLSVPIKGQLVTSAGAVPFTKSHLVTPVTPSRPPPELKMSKTATTKRTVGLNNQAMENAFVANDGPLSKYKAVGGLLNEKSRAKKARELVNKVPASSSVTLKIPKINFAATSTSTMSAGRGRPAGNPLKSIQLKNLNIQLEKLAAERARADPKIPKVCVRVGREGEKQSVELRPVRLWPVKTFTRFI